jgi:hypothetical protein
MIDLLKRMRFTAVDLHDIIDNPAESAKAYGSALAAFIATWLSNNGVTLPADARDALNTAGVGLAMFIVTWLIPRGNKS